MTYQQHDAPTAETDKLWAAGYAVSRGCEIVDAVPMADGYMNFVLDDSDGRATEAIRAFLYGSPRASLHEMRRALRVLHDLIRDARARAAMAQSPQPAYLPTGDSKRGRFSDLAPKG